MLKTRVRRLASAPSLTCIEGPRHSVKPPYVMYGRLFPRPMTAGSVGSSTLNVRETTRSAPCESAKSCKPPPFCSVVFQRLCSVRREYFERPISRRRNWKLLAQTLRQNRRSFSSKDMAIARISPSEILLKVRSVLEFAPPSSARSSTQRDPRICRRSVSLVTRATGHCARLGSSSCNGKDFAASPLGKAGAITPVEVAIVQIRHWEDRW